MKTMKNTNIVLKTTALLLTLLFAMPLVPAMYFDGHLPVAQSIDKELPSRSNLATKAGPVIVGTTSTQGATSLNTERNIVRDKNNNIYVVFESGNQIWFSKSTDNGATFSTPRNVSNDTGNNRQSTTPTIVYNGSALFVAWAYYDLSGPQNQNEFISMRRSNDNGTTWIPPLNQAPTAIPHSGQPTSRRMDPSIAVNNTTVYLASTNGNGQFIYFSRSLDAGVTWGWAGPVFDFTLYDGSGFGNNGATEPVLAVDNETVYVAFTYRGNQADIGYTYSTLGRNIDAANDFSAVTNLYQANTESRYPTIVAKGTNVFVAWEERLNGGAEIYFRNTTDRGTTWTPATGQAPTDVSGSTGNAREPSLTYNKPGSVFCTWRDSSVHGGYDLVYSEWTSGAWTTPTYLTSNDNNTRWPSAAARIANSRLDIVWTNGTNPYDVLYYGAYVGGSAPLLNWTGENGYVTDGVNPDTGTTGHTYTWRVKYTDADNEAPLAGFPKLFIDVNLDGDFLDLGEKISPGAADAADTTYSDGKIYTYSSRLPTVGTYTYQFAAQDVNGRPAGGEPAKISTGPQITSVNEPPLLFWLSDTNYLSDGLDPEVGFTDTNFTYKIMYLDLLGEPPAAGFPKVYIDMDNNGNFNDPSDGKFAMSAVNPTDTSYDNGKIYFYTTTLPTGTYKYMFYAEDLVGLAATTENRTGPVVSGKGNAPVLSTIGTAGFASDGVDPDFGSDTTEFIYMIKFTDADGDLPVAGNPKIGLDLNRDGNISLGEKFPMVEADPLDIDTKDGKVYTYAKVLGVLGQYIYQFEAMDTNLSTAQMLEFIGPNVNITNKKPVLTWLGSTGFESDGLDPETGNANATVFKYNVLYSDPDGNPPLVGYPKLWIDINLDGNENASEWRAMNDPDPAAVDYIGGKKYEYNTTLALPGTYRYMFSAKDSNGAIATGTPVVSKSGPTVTLPPDLNPRLTLLGVGDYNLSGVYPLKGGLDTSFVYKVNYVDLEGDMPGLEWPRVYIDYEGDNAYSGPNDKVGVMTEEDALDTNVVDGKIYTYTTKMPLEGADYAYKFKAEDVDGNTATGSNSIYDSVFFGPEVIVNKDPMLQFVPSAGFNTDGVDPDTGLEGATFTFRVIYKDPEGDKPLDGKIYLRIDLDMNKAVDATDPKITMTEVNPAAQNYVIGKEYSATYSFNEQGTYGYRFETKDANNNEPTGPATVDYITGPIVTEPIPNRLPSLTYTGELNYKTDGVNPLTALKGNTFTYRIRYIDLDNDAPQAGYPRVLVNGQSHIMQAVDTADTNYADGKIYSVDVPLDKAGTYTYIFEVTNAINQTAEMGPLDGPVVTEKVKSTKGQILPDLMWVILLLIMAIVMAIIGYLIGARRKREPEPQYRQAPRTRGQPPRGGEKEPTVPLSKAEVPEEPESEEPVLETPPKAEETPKETPKDAPGPVEKTAAATAVATKTDLKADSEAPASAGEAKAPEAKPGPPVAEETKPDLKSKAGAAEAPADDKDSVKDQGTKTEEKKEEKVDDEIDSILAKLEK